MSSRQDKRRLDFQKIKSAAQGLKCFLICSELCFYLYLGGFLFLYWKLRRDRGLKKKTFFVNITMMALGVISSIQSRRSLRPSISITSGRLWFKALILVSMAITAVYFHTGCQEIGSSGRLGFEAFFGAFCLVLMIPFLIMTIWGLCYCRKFSELKKLVDYQHQVGTSSDSVLDDIKM